MARQNPEFGPVKDAIQDLGTFQLQVSALGFGKPKTDPVDDREVRTDVDGVIWQWDEAAAEWKFVGKSLQSYWGAPFMPFFYYGGNLRYDGTELIINSVRGFHSWPDSDPQLLKLPNQFAQGTMRKTFNPNAPWSSGENGNFHYDNGAGALSSAGQDVYISVALIRRESDGAVDYVGAPYSFFSPVNLGSNAALTLGGVRWRVCGMLGQLIWNDSASTIRKTSQNGKTTHLQEEYQQSFNLSSSTNGIFTGSPLARCHFNVYCGPSTTGQNLVTIYNSFLNFPVVGVNSEATTTGLNINYTTPEGFDPETIFRVSSGVSTFVTRLIAYTEESLSRLG